MVWCPPVRGGWPGWPLAGREAGPEGASGGQVCPLRHRCAGVEAALLRPARAAHTVTFKSRQLVRVLSDRQWQEVLRGVHIERVLHSYRECLVHVHDFFLG